MALRLRFMSMAHHTFFDHTDKPTKDFHVVVHGNLIMGTEIATLFLKIIKSLLIFS